MTVIDSPLPRPQPAYVPRVDGPRLPHRASWYAVATSRSLPSGAVRSVVLAGEEILIWRTASGRVGAAYNACGHLMTRMTPGARVHGESLVCPHHGSCYAVDGSSTMLSSRDLHTLSAQDNGAVILVWFHPDGQAPGWDVPALDDEGWSAWTFRSRELAVHPQHVMQDLADVRHFTTVHGYSELRSSGPTRQRGHALEFGGRARIDPGIGVAVLPFEFLTVAIGLGYQITTVRQLDGVTETRHLVLPTPIDDETTRLTLGVSVRIGTARGPRAARWVAIRLLRRYTFWCFERDIQRDARLWRQRHHIDDVPPGDRDQDTYRQWLTQFDAA